MAFQRSLRYAAQMNRTSRLLAIVLGGLFSFDALSFVPPAPRPPALSSRTASVDANNARVSRRPSPLLSLSIVRTSRAFVCGSRRSRSQPEHLQSLSDHVFRVEESRAAAGGRKARRWVRPGKAVTVLRDRAQDTEIETEFEKELQRDAEEWVDGRPGRQALWDRAQSWRKLNKIRRARTEAMSELERDKLRLMLADAEKIIGVPLLKGKEITPLAWFMTVTIQLMPLAAGYLIFSALVADNPAGPVLDLSLPFWS